MHSALADVFTWMLVKLYFLNRSSIQSSVETYGEFHSVLSMFVCFLLVIHMHIIIQSNPKLSCFPASRKSSTQLIPKGIRSFIFAHIESHIHDSFPYIPQMQETFNVLQGLCSA
jgi:hypothetical protein